MKMKMEHWQFVLCPVQTNPGMIIYIQDSGVGVTINIIIFDQFDECQIVVLSPLEQEHTIHPTIHLHVTIIN